MRNALWMLLAMAILFSLWGLMADKAIAGDEREPQSRTQPLYSLEPTAKAPLGVSQRQTPPEETSSSQAVDYESTPSDSAPDSED